MSRLRVTYKDVGGSYTAFRFSAHRSDEDVQAIMTWVTESCTDFKANVQEVKMDATDPLAAFVRLPVNVSFCSRTWTRWPLR